MTAPMSLATRTPAKAATPRSQPQRPEELGSDLAAPEADCQFAEVPARASTAPVATDPRPAATSPNGPYQRERLVLRHRQPVAERHGRFVYGLRPALGVLVLAVQFRQGRQDPRADGGGHALRTLRAERLRRDGERFCVRFRLSDGNDRAVDVARGDP